jgi:hypothetical protein
VGVCVCKERVGLEGVGMYVCKDRVGLEGVGMEGGLD